MFCCSGCRWLLACALLLCTLLVPTAYADTVATIEVDGANVTVDNTVCATAAWRASSLYAKITPAADIKFEARFNAPYYQQYMKPKVVPNLILLIVAVLLFLFFVFWRWIYCCCTCCCNLCKPSADPMKYIADRGMTATKVTAILMALGVVASGVYGMVEAGPHLVNQTVGTIGTLTGFANDVFGAAYNMTTDADSATNIFDDLVTILNVDVNVSGINSDVACVGSWLNSMVDPSVVAESIESLDEYLTGTLTPLITTLTTDLTAYEASGGDYDLLTGSDMGYVSAASTTLNAYLTQVNAYQTAVAALSTYAATSASTITAAGTALETLLDSSDNTADDLSLKLSEVTDVQTGLVALQQLQTDAASLTSGSPAAPTMLALYNNLGLLYSDAYDLFWHQLPYLITDLSGQYSGYTATQPCLDTLLYQIEHINETVIALPPAMTLSYELLDDLDVAMQALMTGSDTDPQTLATDLTTFQTYLDTSLATLTRFDYVNTTTIELGKIIKYLTTSPPDFDDLVSAVGSLKTDTAASGSTSADYTLNVAYQKYVAYVASATSSTYSAFQTAASAASTALGTTTTSGTILYDLNRVTVTYGTYVTDAVTLANDITGAQTTTLPGPAELQDVLTSITDAEAALPSTASWVAAEVIEGAAYAALPTPKAGVLTAITSTVADLNNKITTTTTEVQADITSYNAQILDKINTLHNDTVDRVTAKENQYLPEVRHYDSYRMTAEYVYFSVVIFIALMLIVIVIINFQWAASFFTFLLLLAMLIYGIIGTVFLLLAVVGHDECSNAETQIFTLMDKLNIGSASLNATTLASYYILGEGGSVNAIAESATGVNFLSIESTINSTIQQTVTGIAGSYTLRYKLQDEVDDVEALGQTLFADVNAVHSLVEFQNVHPIYLGAKQLACCDVVDLVGNLWLSMFMAGWFSVVLAVAMFCYIRRLDELPRKRCCGCAFRSYKEFLDPEDKRLAAIKNKGKYMAAGREGSLPGTPGALSVNAIKVGANGSLSGGLITGVSNMSTTSNDEARPIRAGISEFNSDGTPRASMTPRASSYMIPPESPRVERSTDSQNRQSLLGLQPLSVEGSSGSLLSPGTNKKGAARKSFTTKSEQKKAALKNVMRMNQLE